MLCVPDHSCRLMMMVIVTMTVLLMTTTIVLVWWLELELELESSLSSPRICHVDDFETVALPVGSSV